MQISEELFNMICRMDHKDCLVASKTEDGKCYLSTWDLSKACLDKIQDKWMSQVIHASIYIKLNL